MTAPLRTKALAAAGVSIVALAAATGCEADLGSTERRVALLEVPNRADFNPVADAMQLSCGTLDCHGQAGRNLRLYGHYGLRLDPADDPLEARTTNAEYEASYWSVVALEPETIARVVGKQLAPTWLSMVRKPRGIEKHKGGQLMSEGDLLDRCIVGSLIGAFEFAACNAFVETPRPEPDGGQ